MRSVASASVSLHYYPDGFAAKVDTFLRSFNEYMAVHTENQADGPPTSEPRRYA